MNDIDTQTQTFHGYPIYPLDESITMATGLAKVKLATLRTRKFKGGTPSAHTAAIYLRVLECFDLESCLEEARLLADHIRIKEKIAAAPKRTPEEHQTALQQFDALYADPENHRAIRLGILSVLSESKDLIDDFTLTDLEAESWLAVWRKVGGLSEPSSVAKLQTRLAALARWQARRWRTDKLRNRKRFVSLTKKAFVPTPSE